MLIFNCTEAASKFFSRVHKGKKITEVDYNPPSSIIEDDDLAPFVEQWLVHAITVQRKHVLLAIHIKTRYCMIFADVKKADAEGFIQRFANRWIEGLMRDAINHDFTQWIDGAMPDRLQETCRDHTFYRRSHRSAQKHIDEISWFFQDVAAEQRCLPQGEYPAIGFDGQMNDTPRNSKDRKDYFLPDREMIAHCLRQYCALEEADIERALERRKEAKREIREFMAQTKMNG